MFSSYQTGSSGHQAIAHHVSQPLTNPDQLVEWARLAWPQAEPGAALRRHAVLVMAQQHQGPAGPHSVWMLDLMTALSASAAWGVLFSSLGSGWENNPHALAQPVAAQLCRAGNCFRMAVMQDLPVCVLDVHALMKASSFLAQQAAKAWPALPGPPTLPALPAPPPQPAASTAAAQAPTTRVNLAAATATISRALGGVGGVSARTSASGGGAAGNAAGSAASQQAVAEPSGTFSGGGGGGWWADDDLGEEEDANGGDLQLGGDGGACSAPTWQQRQMLQEQQQGVVENGTASAASGPAPSGGGGSDAAAVDEDEDVLRTLRLLEGPIAPPPAAAPPPPRGDGGEMPSSIAHLLDKDDEASRLVLTALCLATWWPRKPWLLAASLAMTNPPPFLRSSALTQSGISKLSFLTREVQRYARHSHCRGTPANLLHALRDDEPLATLLTAGAASGTGSLHDDRGPPPAVVALDLRRAARWVLVAAGAVQPVAHAREAEAVAAAGVAWPPAALSSLTLSHIHQQAQPALRKVVRALRAKQPSVRERVEAALLRRIRVLAADPPTAAAAAPPAPSAALLGSAAAAADDQPHLRSHHAVNRPAANGARGAAEPAAPSASGGGVAPLYRTMLNVQAVHGGAGAGGVTPERMLRCAAALQLASSWWSGPVGPRSMSAEQLALALAEENLGWAEWCKDRGLAHLSPSEQVRALVDGQVGFYLQPMPQFSNKPAVRLELYDLEKAASRQMLMPPPAAAAAPAAGRAPPHPAAAAAAALAEGPRRAAAAKAAPPQWSEEELTRMVKVAVPGADGFSALQRNMLYLLLQLGTYSAPGESADAPGGGFTFNGSALGQALAARDRELFRRAEPLATPQMQRVKQLCLEMRHLVSHRALPQRGNSIITLHADKLAAAAGVTAAGSSNSTAAAAAAASAGGGAAAAARSQGGASSSAGGGASAVTGADLHALADRLYPRGEPHRADKLAAVLVLGRRGPGSSSGGRVGSHPWTCVGPVFGVELRQATGTVGQSRLPVKQVFNGDPYIRFSVEHSSGLALSLNVKGMVADANKRGIPIPVGLASFSTQPPYSTLATPAPTPTPSQGGASGGGGGGGGSAAAGVGVGWWQRTLPPRARELVRMAEALLPPASSFVGRNADVQVIVRAAKLEAVAVLASLAPRRDAHLFTPSGGEVYAMPGPSAGVELKKGLGAVEWEALPEPRTKQLVDATLGLSVRPSGIMSTSCVVLDAGALERAFARLEGKQGGQGGAGEAAAELGNGGAEERAEQAAAAVDELAKGVEGLLREGADGQAGAGGRAEGAEDGMAVVGLLSPDSAPRTKRPRHLEMSSSGDDGTLAGAAAQVDVGAALLQRRQIEEEEADVDDVLQLLLD